jgi:hypothetical protein
MAISRASTSTVGNRLPKSQKMWDRVTPNFKSLDCFNDGSQVHWWKLEDTTDENGNANLSNFNGVTFTSGINGNAATYDGTLKSLWKDSNTTMVGNGPRTYSAWVFTNTGATGRQLIYGQGGFSSNNQNFDLEVNSYHSSGISDSYGLHWWGNGCKFDSATTLYNQWVHLVLVFDGGSSFNLTNTRLYLNGVKKTLNSFITGSGGGFTIQSTNKIRVGTRYAPGLDDLPVNGKIDQVRIFKKSLTDAEALALYNGGVPV